MADTLTPSQRSERMSRVRARDTRPELAVRRVLHRSGYRYRLQGKDLPGRPDIVFRCRKKAIFVHGCFWHRHPGCALARMPKSRVEFWVTKLEGNRDRDLRNQAALIAMGWEFLVIWECEIGNTGAMEEKLRQFLGSTREVGGRVQVG
ncbi:very short patch repair endonuclease [Roseospirillum parvum]|uniref:very short patch repair endonuclease n=1 Tax=Roseospirillum parvum TaxID=83401 RepID=UPI000B82655C|nr:very short patch repair endonuclease [Roseospirillum parvum]